MKQHTITHVVVCLGVIYWDVAAGQKEGREEELEGMGWGGGRGIPVCNALLTLCPLFPIQITV